MIRARVMCTRSRHGKRRGRLGREAGGGRGDEGRSFIWYEGGFFGTGEGPGKTKRTVRDLRKLVMVTRSRREDLGKGGTKRREKRREKGKGKRREKGRRNKRGRIEEKQNRRDREKKTGETQKTKAKTE